MRNGNWFPAGRALIGSALFVLLSTFSMQQAAHAAWSVHGGAEGGKAAGSAFVAVEAPISGSLRDGFVHRLLLDWQEHSFQTQGIAATRRSPGAEYSLGYRSSGRDGWWGGYLGLQYRETDVSPPQAESEVADEALRLGFHLDGALQLSQAWRAGGRLDTYPQTRGFAVRGRLLRKLKNGFSLGPDVLLEADDDHETQQVGLVVTAPERTPGLRMAATAGVQRDDDGALGAYVGFEFSRRF
jgi:hypothetical protein